MADLELERAPGDRRLYVLDGIGTLRLSGLFSRAATADVAGRRWRFARRGFWQRGVEASDEAGTVVGDPEQFLDGEYGRLRTIVLDAEGALWITTSNRDGVGTPAEDDDKVLRILPPSAAGNSPL